jgi:hypothetical protein
MFGYADHRFVGRQFWQTAGIHAVDFKKIQSGLDGRPFVAVKVSLAFSKVVGVGCGDFVEVAISVEVYVLRLGYGRLQSVFAANAGHAAPRLKLVTVNRVDLLPGKEDGLLFQEKNRRPDLFGETTKQPSMQRAGFPMGPLELLIGGGAGTGTFSIHARFLAVRLGSCRPLRNGLWLCVCVLFHGSTLNLILSEFETERSTRWGPNRRSLGIASRSPQMG